MFRIRILIPLAVFLFILFFRAYVIFTPDKAIFERCSSSNDNHSLSFDQQRLKTFQTLLRFQTISYDKSNQNIEEIKKCRDFIKQRYGNLVIKYAPFVQVHDIAEYSLLYSIQGKDPELKPFLLSSHMDVVPIGNRDRWKHSAFDAYADEEFIFARGTLDDKGNLFTMMEALLEYLSLYGQPSRTFYVAITHDEEVGKVGASGIAHYLAQQPFGHNGQFEFIVDEGTIIMEEAFPTLSNPIAIIGVAEKGYMSIKYKVDVAPGHSSMPSIPSAIGIMASAVVKLENTPQPSHFGRGIEVSLLNSITAYVGSPLRLVLSNLWLFGHFVEWVFTKKPGTNALQRTTTAVSLISGGEKENILPTSASATVNHRIHPADSCTKVFENNRRIINDDRITAHIISCAEPSHTSPYGKNVYAYRLIEQTIHQTFDKDHDPVIVVPGMMLGATDSRSYLNLSKNIYRFSPFIYRHDDLDRLHGDNERIRHKDVQRGLNFYFHLILNSQLKEIPDSTLHKEL